MKTVIIKVRDACDDRGLFCKIGEKMSKQNRKINFWYWAIILTLIVLAFVIRATNV